MLTILVITMLFTGGNLHIVSSYPPNLANIEVYIKNKVSIGSCNGKFPRMKKAKSHLECHYILAVECSLVRRGLNHIQGIIISLLLSVPAHAED